MRHHQDSSRFGFSSSSCFAREALRAFSSPAATAFASSARLRSSLAFAEAAKAQAAAAKASELARLAEEAKEVAAGLEKARASRAKRDEDEKPNLDDVASDELARRLHSEMNASPRLSRGGERAAASSPVVVAPPA